MGRKNTSKIKFLSQQVDELQRRLAELTQQHCAQVLKYSFLKGLAEGMEAFHVCQAVCSLVFETTNLSTPLVNTEQLESLMASENELLRQLEEAGVSSSSSSSGSGVLTDLGVSTISPAHDPMEYFKHLLRQTVCHDGMAGVTAKQVALETRQAFLKLGIQLNRLEDQLTATEAAAAIKDIQDGYNQTLASLIIMGKADVIAKFQCFNLETMESGPSFFEAATEHALRVAPHLGLTKQQAHTISSGMDLYLSLMEGIQTEQVCLKLSLSTIDQADGSSDACRSSAGLDGHAVRLEELQQLYQRLQSMLRKEYILQFVMCGWLVGSLSYRQLAKATVLCWPFVLRVPHLGIGIQKSYRQQQQQQQQQMGQPRASEGPS